MVSLAILFSESTSHPIYIEHHVNNNNKENDSINEAPYREEKQPIFKHTHYYSVYTSTHGKSNYMY